jgi:hypothetical protein
MTASALLSFRRIAGNVVDINQHNSESQRFFSVVRRFAAKRGWSVYNIFSMHAPTPILDSAIISAQVDNPTWEHSLFLKLFVTTSGGW